MEINISGCKFTGNGLSYPTIRIIGQVKYDDKNNPYRYADTASFKSLNVSDCQFTSLNKGSGIIGFAYGDSFIKNYDSTNPTLVTFSNNSVNKDITADKYVVAAGANCTLGELFAASIK